MDLNKIKGSTYYIDSPTNIGVYSFKNKNCLLIDTGINNSTAKKIDDILIKNNLHPKYIINTHSHMDHCGGNSFFKTHYPGCEIFTSTNEKLYIENTFLYSSMLYSSHAIKPLRNSSKAPKVDFELEIGMAKIGDEKFEILNLKGHALGQIGIITPEKVCFLGDSVFSFEILEKYSLPYLNNIEESLSTLEFLKTVDADFFLPSHSSNLLESQELLELLNKNIENINEYVELLLEILDQPATKEDLVENLCILKDLKLDIKQYHITYSTVSAFLTYLYDKNLIDYSLENGRLYYFKKS
ncbi:MBL fold metallo-hydrolase [Haloimpatiens sp. FM7315]|uniref:MBL fold metallo-hydrolase n=1 Tax=Haloimpatiens sp. FM7315 TaxID=3298609 RepID=UPI00370A7C44